MTTNRGLWIGVLGGAPLIALGAFDAFSEADRTKPAELVRWVVGAALVVDLLVVPVSLAIGRLVGGRPPLRWALASTATLMAVGWPFVRGYGRNAGNPSLLPRDYGAGIAVAAAAVWMAALVWCAGRALRARPARHPDAAPEPNIV
jgi:hypothetical protein